MSRVHSGGDLWLQWLHAGRSFGLGTKCKYVIFNTRWQQQGILRVTWSDTHGAGCKVRRPRAEMTWFCTFCASSRRKTDTKSVQIALNQEVVQGPNDAAGTLFAPHCPEETHLGLIWYVGFSLITVCGAVLFVNVSILQHFCFSGTSAELTQDLILSTFFLTETAAAPIFCWLTFASPMTVILIFLPRKNIMISNLQNNA